MKNKELLNLEEKLGPVYKRAKESIAELPLIKQRRVWYIYVAFIGIDNPPCDFCKQEEQRHVIMEVGGKELSSFDILDIRERIFIVCDNCLSKKWIVQRDIWGNRFFENWDSEVGVEIVCLHCGKKDFVYASWNSWGGREVVEEWVARKEREHTNICEDC
jgi:hypothetical protein